MNLPLSASPNHTTRQHTEKSLRKVLSPLALKHEREPDAEAGHGAGHHVGDGGGGGVGGDVHGDLQVVGAAVVAGADLISDDHRRAAQSLPHDPAALLQLHTIAPLSAVGAGPICWDLGVYLLGT